MFLDFVKVRKNQGLILSITSFPKEIILKVFPGLYTLSWEVIVP
jgi:hypothetical protein